MACLIMIVAGLTPVKPFISSGRPKIMLSFIVIVWVKTWINLHQHQTVFNHIRGTYVAMNILSEDDKLKLEKQNRK
ncbi:hypothetical protein N8156_04315 [Rhodospirillaceae bacterium]|nr:hypothetical protein [Rhodospirillaceae bacterium]